MSFTRVNTHDFSAWKESYMTALFEVDKRKLLERIDEAEAAVVLRTRELFQGIEHHQQERKALEAALCALRVLRSINQRQSAPLVGRRSMAA